MTGQPDQPQSIHKPEKPGFWQTLPGILTGVGTLLGAIAGLIAVLIQLGTFRDEQQAANAVPGALQVHSAAVRVDPATVEGNCPVEVTFAADLTLSGAAGTISYRWVWDDRDDSDEREVQIAAGETARTIEFTERLGQPFGLRDRLIDDEVGIEIISPNHVSSPKADVTIDCR